MAVANYRSGKTEEFKATGNRYFEYFAEDSEITVMADNGTASASECLIGAMVDYGAVSYENIYLSTRSGETENVRKRDHAVDAAANLFGKIRRHQADDSAYPVAVDEKLHSRHRHSSRGRRAHRRGKLSDGRRDFGSGESRLRAINGVKKRERF